MSAEPARLLLIWELVMMITLSEAVKLPAINIITCRVTSPTEWMSKVVNPDSIKLQHTLEIESAQEELKTCAQWELT